VNSHQAHERSEAPFKKEGRREAHGPATEYEEGLDAVRLKTKPLRALRVLRDFANRQGLSRPEDAVNGIHNE
jgi:hypothetical protein